MSSENALSRGAVPDGSFTVVIPVWNGRATIERAIESASTQNHPPEEIIVVDDGSTDGTGAMVRERFPSVRVIAQGNSGEGAARRRGILAANADWIAFLDADDMWSPHHLGELLELRTRFPAAQLIATAHIEVPVGRGITPLPIPRCVSRKEIDYFKLAAREISAIWTSSAAAQREALIREDCFVESALGVDLAAWARLALKHPVAISSRPTAYYLRRAGSLMAVNSRAAVTESFSTTLSMKVVLRAIERGEHTAPMTSLQAYLDGRIISGWKRLLLLGDRRAARERLSHLRRPWSPRALRMRISAVAPAWFGPILYKVVLRLRQVRVRDSVQR